MEEKEKEGGASPSCLAARQRCGPYLQQLHQSLKQGGNDGKPSNSSSDADGDCWTAKNSSLP